MNIAGLLLAEGTTLAAGFGLAAWLRPGRAVSRLEVAGLASALGPAVISILLLACGCFLQGTMLVATITLLTLVLAAVGVTRVRRFEWVSLVGSRAFVCGLLVLLLIVGWQAGNHPLTADGLFNFEIRAQLIAVHGGHLPTAFFSDPSRAWMHLDYPLLVPLNQAWLYLCLGGSHQGMLPLLSMHLAAAAGCLLYSGVARLTGESWRAGLAMGMLVLLPSAMFAPGGVASMWADFSLAVLFLGAVLYLVEFAASGRALAGFASFLALLPWAKREGVVLAAVLVLVAAVLAWKRGQARSLTFAILPLAMVWLGWKVFLASVHVSPNNDFVPVSLSALARNVDRLPFLALALGRELLAWARWNILWPLSIPAIVLIARQPELRQWRLLAPLMTAPLVIYTGIYLFSAWNSLPLHVMTSLPRLMLPPAMAAIVAIAVSIPLPGAKACQSGPASPVA